MAQQDVQQDVYGPLQPATVMAPFTIMNFSIQ